MKLDFFCIGAQKAGTTTLHDILNTHPEIYLPPRKEAQFFDINERYEKGLNYYFSTFFSTYAGEKYIGNINPNLQLEERSIDRLISCFGKEIKIVFILRNPVKRAYSHYLMSKRRGIENLSFIEALEAENRRLQNPIYHPEYITNELGHFEKNHLGYIYRSSYSKTIDYLYQKFDKQKIKIILFEDFVLDRENAVKDVLEFLNIPFSHELNFFAISNVASEPKSTFVRDIVYKPNLVKRFLRKMLSKRDKERIKSFINTINNKPLSLEKKEIPVLDRKIIYEKYFKSEVEKIEELTDLDLERWKR